MRDQMPMDKEISLIVSAPSGAGKTTIIRELMKADARFTLSVSTTTRSKRSGEIGGKSYYYTDDKEFQRMIDNNEFVEWARVHSHYYGTSKKEVDRLKGQGRIPVFDVDVQGAKNLRGCLSGAVLVFIIPPSVKSLEERLTKRNTENADELSIRLGNAAREMHEFIWYDYVIINDNVDRAVGDMRAIIRAEEISKDRMCAVVENILEEYR
jgi:guanylate kinase